MIRIDRPEILIPVFFFRCFRSRRFHFDVISMIPVNYRFVSAGFAPELYSLNPCSLVILGVWGFMNDMLRYFPASYTTQFTRGRHFLLCPYTAV